MRKPTDDQLRAVAKHSYGACSQICGHEQRNHYLGGGIWVCFECWAKLLVGGRRRA